MRWLCALLALMVGMFVFEHPAAEAGDRGRVVRIEREVIDDGYCQNDAVEEVRIQRVRRARARRVERFERRSRSRDRGGGTSIRLGVVNF